MGKGFYYIVVTLGDNQYFVNTDMDYTDNFDTVLRFVSREEAEDHILKHELQNKSARILPSGASPVEP